ncbi:MAG: TOBE domain-containing protein [Caldilineaceae bacterium]|nr:TOBE domain-containing protein [Caldilineaceae bacterium]
MMTAESAEEGIPCRIMLVEHIGATNLFYVDLQGQRLVVTTDADFYLPPATNAVLHFNPAKVHFFAAEGGRNLTL